MGERKERDQCEGGKVGGREEGRRKWSNKKQRERTYPAVSMRDISTISPSISTTPTD